MQYHCAFTFLLLLLIHAGYGCKPSHAGRYKEYQKSQHLMSEKDKPKIIQQAQTQSVLKLVDYQYSEKSGHYAPTGIYNFEFENHNSFEQDLSRFFPDNDLDMKYKIPENILNNTENTDFLIADITPSGFVFDIQSRQLLSNHTGMCFSAVFESMSNAFYLSETYLIEPQLKKYAQGFVILLSGRLCLDAEGRLEEFRNNGSMSIAKSGILNLYDILVVKGIRTKELQGSNLQLQNPTAKNPSIGSLRQSIPELKQIKTSIQNKTLQESTETFIPLEEMIAPIGFFVSAGQMQATSFAPKP